MTSSPPQPHHIPKGKVFAFESARGDDPEGWVVGCFVGEGPESVGQVDEDSRIVDMELFVHVIKERHE